jgi:hypothetical protein
MASTVRAATRLQWLPGGQLAGAKRITYGTNVLSSGGIELDTGLNRVDLFIAVGGNNPATECLVLECKENLPTSTGTITVDGSLIDEGSATKDGGSSEFHWVALGE